MTAIRKKSKAEIARENGKLGGRPVGGHNRETLIRREILAAVQQRIMRAADLLLDSQLTIARGQTFLYKIEKYWVKEKDKKGNDVKILRQKPPQRVEDEAEMRAFIEGEIEKENGNGDLSDPEDTYYFLTAKEPDNNAINSMFKRVFGNTVQPIAITDVEGTDIIDDESTKKAQLALGEYLGNPGHSRARRKEGN